MKTRERDGGSGVRIWLVVGVIALVIAWILFMKMQEPLPPRTPPPGDAGSSKR
jgi:hypothetical protein